MIYVTDSFDIVFRHILVFATCKYQNVSENYCKLQDPNWLRLPTFVQSHIACQMSSFLLPAGPWWWRTATTPWSGSPGRARRRRPTTRWSRGCAAWPSSGIFTLNASLFRVLVTFKRTAARRIKNHESRKIRDYRADCMWLSHFQSSFQVHLQCTCRR